MYKENMIEEKKTRNEVSCLIHGDCLVELPKIPDKAINLIYTDPPFNIGYNYNEYNDNKTKEEYLSWCSKWLAESYRVLADNGSIFVSIGDEYAAEMKILMNSAGFHLRNWIIWQYGFGVQCTKKFARTHTHILYMVKNPSSFVFNADEVRVPSLRQTKYNDKRANSKGKVPDDTWYNDVWKISRVCGTFKERTEHPCQQPLELVERCIKVASNKGDKVLDFFAGSGTTLEAAKRLGREYLGIELSKEYIHIIEQRLRLCS